jgi:hypothetical protein
MAWHAELLCFKRLLVGTSQYRMVTSTHTIDKGGHQASSTRPGLAPPPPILPTTCRATFSPDTLCLHPATDPSAGTKTQFHASAPTRTRPGHSRPRTCTHSGDGGLARLQNPHSDYHTTWRRADAQLFRRRACAPWAWGCAGQSCACVRRSQCSISAPGRNTIQCVAPRCTVLQHSTLWCNTVRCGATQNIVLQHNKPWCNTGQCVAPQYTVFASCSFRRSSRM